MYRDAAPRPACAVHPVAAAHATCEHCGALTCEPCTLFVGCAVRCVACAQRVVRARERERSIGRVALGVVAGVFLLTTTLACLYRDVLRWGEQATGIKASRAALELAPCSDRRLDSLVAQLAEVGDTRTAYDTLSAFRRRCGTTESTLRVEARLWATDHAWTEEIVALRRLVEREPGNFVLRARLGEAYELVHERLLAADTYTRIVCEFGTANAVWEPFALRLAGLYLDIGRLDLATQIRKSQHSEGCVQMALPDPFYEWPDDAR